MILQDVQQKLKTKHDVLPYLVTQMWENKKSNVQCVSCRKNYNYFTNKTVTCRKRKTGTYTGSSFGVTHMNKKNTCGYLKSYYTWSNVFQQSSLVLRMLWSRWLPSSALPLELNGTPCNLLGDCLCAALVCGKRRSWSCLGCSSRTIGIDQCKEHWWFQVQR